MNFWIVIGIVIGIILFTGISIKGFFYARQKDWCPNIINIDKVAKNKFDLLMERIINLETL